MLKTLFNYSLFLGATALLISCSESKLSQQDTSGDQEKILQHYGQAIMNGYRDFDSLAQELKVSFEDFKNSPDSTLFISTQTSHLEAWKGWVRVESFEFGPAKKNIRQTKLKHVSC